MLCIQQKFPWLGPHNFVSDQSFSILWYIFNETRRSGKICTEVADRC